MRVVVDRNRCEGHGLCEEVAPDLFELDEEGELTVVPEETDLNEAQTVRATGAVRVCPVAALTIRD